MASTPVGSTTVIMEVLDQNNYKDWRSRLETYLLAEDLWEVVEANEKPPKAEDDQAEYKAWSKNNAKALYAIQNSCGREVFSLINEIKTAKGAWDALEQEFIKVLQGYDETNADHVVRFKSFIKSVTSGDWDEAKKCLGDVDVRSVLVKELSQLEEGWEGARTLHVAACAGHAHIVKELVQLMTRDDLKTQTNYGATALHLAAWQGHVHVVKELPVALMGEVKDKGGATALHIAVRKGKVDVVKELLKMMREEDLKIKNDAGYTALHLAVNKGDMPMVKELVKMMRKEDLKIKNDAGYTALHLAVNKRDMPMVKELVKMMREEDLKIKNDVGYTALHLAVNKGDMPMVKEFVRKQQGENNIGQEEDFERYRPFTQYVSDGDWDKANECLRELDDPCGAITAVDPRDGWGHTALHVAAFEGHLGVTKGLVVLLKKREEDLELKTAEDFTTFGAGITLEVSEEVLMERAKYMVGQWEKTLGRILEMRNAKGSTALHVAVLYENVEIVKEVAPLMRQEGLELKDANGSTALHAAVFWENVEIVKEVAPLMRQEGLELKDADGSTALYAAVLDENVEIVKEVAPLMRQEGLELKNAYGSTALHAAVLYENVEIVKEVAPLMRQEGLELKDANGSTALHAAVFWENVEIVKEVAPLMRQEGLELKDADGSTALHAAFYCGNLEIVKELMKLMRQEGLELKDADGSTALHAAFYCGNLEIVKELMKLMRQEGLELKDADGSTALITALWKGDVDIAKELVKLMRSGGLEIKDNMGSNALHLAVTEEYVEIVTQIIPLMRPEALGDKDGEGYTALGWAIQCLKDGDVCRLAEIMNTKNNEVFGIPSAPDNDIPALHALRWNKWKSARIISSLTPPSVFTGPNGLAFICYCLNARIQIDLVCRLLRDYTISSMTAHEIAQVMLMLSRMNFAPLSGRQLTPWKRWIYDRIHVDDHNIKRDFFSSVLNLFLKGLQNPFGIRDLYEMKASYTRICTVLSHMSNKTRYNLNLDVLNVVKTSIFNAIQQGNSEFVTHVLKENPDLFKQLNRQVGKGIFHLAVENRQKEVFNLIYGLKEKERHAIGLHVVNQDNNLLHYAANLSSVPQFGQILDASLQMQRELQWFKEVERVVPREMYERRNCSDNMTARELFAKNHKKLMGDAETSIKATADSCTVVGALIVTIMFAAAFTVPGGNDSNTGFPLLIDRKLFNIFILADTISLVSSTSSVITFLGMRTSRYAEDDFLKSLPTKMMIGLMTLFFAIVNMMIAFSCALIIMFEEKIWVITVSILLASIPIILFVWLLFPLLIKTFMSTFGREIFDKKKKSNRDLITRSYTLFGWKLASY